ncbi:MAG: bifunctional phosphoribosylaminoimidazolecarboxamide formyltransferase/IMP cyclohydrolase [Proteobacteria bacterium]|nr:bifunctional phosphoribosylaminoimidazolecarboxamide formyltransferase/IMP cyclohydrolase [Pseudomonadota bacterium]
MKIRRAILSVSDKREIVEFARGLARFSVEILSTGGTARALREAGISTTPIAEYTGAPEILDGRVKTLHPRIHGGLLGRASPDHDRQMAEHDIAPIDLVAVNLYPFEETIARPGIARTEAIENIDIGGPAMLRSAAKNHERVAVIVDPADYADILDELEQNGGELVERTLFALACKAFAHTAAYDGAIAAYLSSLSTDVAPAEPSAAKERRAMPDILTVQWRRVRDLRYGENPHQSAAFYADRRSPLVSSNQRPSLASAEILQGKALSYNNILDLDAALACCLEFAQPTAVVVKHTNPCGVASDQAGVARAYELARATDPTSSFGGIVAVNRTVDRDLASQLAETFLECVVAPDYSEAARSILAEKKRLRLVATGPWRVGPDDTGWAMRSVAGGLLVQSADYPLETANDGDVVTERAPTADELGALDFAWRVGKHIKSNAIVFCRGSQTVGIGAGQMSRVDSVRIAQSKAESPLQNTCVASDAFFPFRDGIDALAEAGATAVIQPGGSIRDAEVIAAANQHGLAMVFTGQRHFRH